MRLARIATAAGPRPVCLHDGRWHEVADPFADTPAFTGPAHDPGTVQLLAPAEPRVVLGMAHNGAPGDRELPPQAFMKSPRTVVGPDHPIVVDEGLGQVNVEGELAVVIRRTCRRLRPEDVPSAILGYTIGNDVTAVEQIALDDKLTQAKHGDGFTPLGPWIETDLDPGDVPIAVRVDGVTVAEASTRQLAWNVTEQLVHLTRYLTLGPGDVVLTGCPFTFAPVEPGDRAEITLDGIGTLSNPVRAL
ncbi:fumarylacetoacetate hydrolase family protein [Rhodococcus jostii]|uniref:2-keto-4-pentenoate hydratase/2-oxohepta-3-ene-1,7-dioic acid hydratase (Catechol pathway) n=1 Tax=Rhodococcus jostii TaxID=132919 RepID=A0A1H5C5F3_RHOJO|nr:fumarylacetoacetate hydrolase family protein [Rhodococcus jostii]SED61604.1 2-keto-4-pentenoate hydratase/2-oxohepta-3-ene-1,7-dioic acid hydratase (catechol pathway) [Rhodococcus jostii]